MSGFIDSEIAPLESVIVHTPGYEVEAMTPESAEELLYNEIVPVASVQREHAVLKSVLQSVATVYEFTDLLTTAVEASEPRRALVQAVGRYSHAPEREEELLSLPSAELVRALVGGVRQRRDTLTTFLEERLYDIPPLPNLYFTRDGAAVIRDRLVFGRMAHPVRTVESLLLKTLFHQCPELAHEGVLFDGLQESSDRVSLEGGDILVLNRNTLLLGVSERTTTAAIDRLAESLLAAFQEPFDLFAVMLPKKRATIHLDTVFTLLDHSLALAYEPLVRGSDAAPVYRMRYRPGERTEIEAVPDLPTGLRDAGLHIDLVPCGGREPVRAAREQWLAAANAFAVGPGKILVYDCNEETLRALEQAGFTVVSPEDVLSQRERLTREGRIAVALPGLELARGGGGPRCMTLPVSREPAP
jgi:arginine deiminase